MGRPPRGNGNGGGRPPDRPQPPTIPPPVDDRKERKKQAVTAIGKFFRDERQGGRGKPNRRAIEAHIRNANRINQKQLDEALTDMYDQLADIGLINARR